MSYEYYLMSGNQNTGPYELVSLVIKIRNGSISAETPVQRSDSPEARSAQEWPELKEFFSAEQPNKKDQAQNDAKNIELAPALARGVNFLQHNPISTVFSGIFILAIIIVTALVNLMLPDVLHVLGYIVGFITLHFMLSCYLLVMLRMIRGQPLNPSYFMLRIKAVFLKLLRASVVASFPVVIGILLLTAFEDELFLALLGLLIIIIPGIYIVTIYSFAPLLIIDQGMNVWDALQTSRSMTLKRGLENFGVYFSLNAINFIAGLFMLLPMVISLPVTLSAIAETYDENAF